MISALLAFVIRNGSAVYTLQIMRLLHEYQSNLEVAPKEVVLELVPPIKSPKDGQEPEPTEQPEAEESKQDKAATNDKEDDQKEQDRDQNDSNESKPDSDSNANAKDNANASDRNQSPPPSQPSAPSEPSQPVPADGDNEQSPGDPKALFPASQNQGAVFSMSMVFPIAN